MLCLTSTRWISKLQKMNIDGRIKNFLRAFWEPTFSEGKCGLIGAPLKKWKAFKILKLIIIIWSFWKPYHIFVFQFWENQFLIIAFVWSWYVIPNNFLRYLMFLWPINRLFHLINITSSPADSRPRDLACSSKSTGSLVNQVWSWC